MTRPFLHQHTLHLTPLSPLHLGTGEDYSPTGYLISDGIMYVFDPAQAVLNPIQYDELMTAARRGSLTEVQKYFKKHADTFKNCAHKAISVSAALEKEYADKLGHTAHRESSSRKIAANRLEIRCTAANPLNHLPYIPGSAFKGSVRTALLDALTRANPPQPRPDSRSHLRYENERLGSFSSDIMRLFKTADFMPSENVSTQIQYAVNKKKHQAAGTNRPIQSQAPTIRYETVQHGQYRAFQTACRLQRLLLEHRPQMKQPGEKLPKPDLQPMDMRRIAQAVNAFNLPRLNAENSILDQRSLVDPAWLKDTRDLLETLKPQLDNGSIMLMRLGKHGGAESKTLTGLAQIRIIQGKGRKAALEPRAGTVWLAAGSDKATHGMLPFGWVLVEIDAQGDNAAIKGWCEKHSRHLTDTRDINAKLAEGRLKAEEAGRIRAEEQTRKAAAQAAAEKAAQEAAEAKAAALSAMSPAQRLIVLQTEALANFAYDSRNQQAADGCYKQIVQALTEAQSMDTDGQKQIAEGLSWPKISKIQPRIFSGKREKEIKALLRILRGE